jgi:uridylate kinase
MELRADVLMKATKVDGIYDKDPKQHADAVLIKEISYRDVIARGLGVMDATAITLCMDNRMPILVLNLTRPGSIVAAASGEPIGSIVKE